MSTLDDMMPPAPMMSERQPFIRATLDEINSIIDAGRFSTEPVRYKNGKIEFQRGAYQRFRYKNGARVYVFARKAQDLVLEDIVVDEALSNELAYDEQGKKGAPIPVGTILPARLKDLGNGNLDRLFVFAPARGDSVKKDPLQEMRSHQDIWMDMSLRFGLLKHIDENLWVSKGLIYQYIPEDYNDPSPDAKGELIVTPAPHGGWRMDHQYDLLFEGWGRVGRMFMQAASKRAKNISRADAEATIKADFGSRAFSFVSVVNPYNIPLPPEVPGKLNWDKRTYPRLRNVRAFVERSPVLRPLLIPGKIRPFAKKIPQTISSTYYGIRQASWRDIIESLAIMAAMNVALITGTYVFALILAQQAAINPFLFTGRWASQSMGRTGQRILNYSRQASVVYADPANKEIMKQLTHDWTEKQFLGGPLKGRAMRIHLQGEDYEDLQVDSHAAISVMEVEDRDHAGLSYIMGTHAMAYNSAASMFKNGAHKGVRIDECSGLSVEYIPAQKACFARLDWTRLDRDSLPDEVMELFIKAGLDKPYLMIEYDPADNTMNPRFLSQAEYKHAWTGLGRPHTVEQAQAKAEKPYVAVYQPAPEKRSTTVKRLSKIFGQKARGIADKASEIVDQAWDKFVDIFTP